MTNHDCNVPPTPSGNIIPAYCPYDPIKMGRMMERIDTIYFEITDPDGKLAKVETRVTAQNGRVDKLDEKVETLGNWRWFLFGAIMTISAVVGWEKIFG